MSKDSSLARAEQARGALREWLEGYIRQRDQSWWCGEFLDEDGRTNEQRGLAGAALISFLERRLKLQPAKFQRVFCILGTALETGSPSGDERKLLKDVPRVTTKAILLALGPEDEIKSWPIVHQILTTRGTNGLVKPILDDPQGHGDPVVTAIVILFLVIAGKANAHMTEIYALLDELRRQLRQEVLELYDKLLVSTALCCIDHANDIGEHRRLLSELYASTQEWHRAFSSNSPFIDQRFADRTAPGGARDRYVRVPIGFVVLAAIYMSVGDEREFFDFPPVRRLVTDIRIPFSAHVGRDRNKASVYYAWYTYIALHPAEFLHAPRQPKLSIILSRFMYAINDLTMVGGVVLTFLLAGLLGMGWFVYVGLNKGLADQFGNFIGAAGTAVGSLLGLFKTRKR